MHTGFPETMIFCGCGGEEYLHFHRVSSTATFSSQILQKSQKASNHLRTKQEFWEILIPGRLMYRVKISPPPLE